jgi:hypothetical protein
MVTVGKLMKIANKMKHDLMIQSDGVQKDRFITIQQKIYLLNDFMYRVKKEIGQ